MSRDDSTGLRDVTHSASSDLHALFDSYRRSASSAAELVAAEADLAASSAVLLVGLSIAIALLLTTAWIMSMLAIAAAFVAPATWALPLGLVAGSNLAAAYAAWLWVRSLASDLTFPELRGLLQEHGRTGSESAAETP